MHVNDLIQDGKKCFLQREEKSREAIGAITANNQIIPPLLSSSRRHSGEERNSSRETVADLLTDNKVHFGPGEFDVICGRGKFAQQHIGNQWFKRMLELFVDRYADAHSKAAKSMIVSEVITYVRRKSPNGGFLKKVKTQWEVVGDRLAREKVGQFLRDALHSRYKSSATTKRTRRNVERSLQQDYISGVIVENKVISTSIFQIKQDSQAVDDEAELINLFTNFNISVLDELKRQNLVHSFVVSSSDDSIFSRLAADGNDASKQR